MNGTKNEDPVMFEMIGEKKFKISYNSALLEDHLMDYLAVPEEKRPGQMRKLLCASVAGCFTASVYMALSTMGVKINSLKGTAAAFSAEDIGSLPKIKAVDIKVEIDIDDKDSDIFEEVKKIFEKGCLITRSISPAIKVTHSISRI